MTTVFIATVLARAPNFRRTQSHVWFYMLTTCILATIVMANDDRDAAILRASETLGYTTNRANQHKAVKSFMEERSNYNFMQRRAFIIRT